MTGRPFRFGAVLGGARSGDDWRDLARRAESLGYSTLLLPDAVGPTLAPMVALAAAASATRTIRLGTYVLAGSYRNPLLLAHEAATLDLVSNGRVELGLGAGRDDHDYASLGLAREPAAARVDRLAETLRVIDPLLRGQRVERPGVPAGADRGPALPPPVQRPRLPILVPGAGRRVLSLAARHADIVTVAAGPSPETFAERLEWVREAAGDRFDSIELNQTLHAAGGHVNPHLAAVVGVSLDRAIASGSLYLLPGPTDRMCDELLRRRDRYGVSYFAAAGIPLEALAPVIERLAGR